MSDTNTVLGAIEDGKVFMIPLECIGTYNVRSVLPRLAESGQTYEGLIRLALGTAEQRAEMVRLVQEHEAETLRLDPKAHTILMLADSIFDKGQLAPIIVRQTGQVARRDTDGTVIEGQKRYGYMVVMGGRRTMATAYLYALGLIDKPAVRGFQKKMSKEEAMELSIAENLQRADFTDRQIGEFVATYRETGKTWAEIVKIMRRSEQTLRDAYLIVRPEATDAPTDLAEQVQRGEITKGQAVQIATGKARLGDGGERLFQKTRKAISVKAIEALIDATERDDTGRIRITAFAEALDSTYEAELAASDARLAKVKAKAEAEALKKQAADLMAKAKEMTTVTTVTVTETTETLIEAA